MARGQALVIALLAALPAGAAPWGAGEGGATDAGPAWAGLGAAGGAPDAAATLPQGPALALALLRAHEPLPGLAGMVEGWLPEPFGTSDGARRLAEPFEGVVHGPGPLATFTGDVLLEANQAFTGDVVFEGARVRFAPGATMLEVRASGSLTVRDSSFEAPARATVRAYGPLSVLRGTFEGVTLGVMNGTGAAVVEDSTFRHGGTGLATLRSSLEVRRSVFLNLTTALDVDAVYAPELGPTADDNTFEHNFNGIAVGSKAAGLYRRNLARANLVGVSCQSAGGNSTQGELVPPRFEENNLHGNYGEAINGLRGVTITTPAGTIEVSNSRCEHEKPYLGPSASPDTTFLSSDDTLANVTSEANPSQARPLPWPIRLVTGEETWEGSVSLDGPVVVQGGELTLDGATVTGPYYVGAQKDGLLVVQDSTLDPGAKVVLRNDHDAVRDSVLGGPDNLGPLVMFRCNCSLEDSTITAGPGLAVLTLSGLLTDDYVWFPEVRGNAITTPGAAVLAFLTRPTIASNTVLSPKPGTGSAIVQALGTASMEKNTVRGFAAGALGLIGTTSSTDDVFEANLVGYLGLLDSGTFAKALFASHQIALYPLLNAATTVTLSNFTFNAMGVVPALGVPAITSSDFWHNYLLAAAAFRLDPGNLSVPTGLTCTTCWAPSDEAWYGNVTWTMALAPNQVPKPPWASRIQVAGQGQTLDLEGTLDAPAVARSGGTLRVRHATLDLDQRYPVGAKGGGMEQGSTGTLVLEHATLRRGGFVALNSTSSTLTHVRLEDFPGTALQAQGNGPEASCVEVRRAGAAMSFLGMTGPALEARRLRVEDANGLTVGLLANAYDLVNATLEDGSAKRSRGQGLLSRVQQGEVEFVRNNLLVGARQVGVVDSTKNLSGQNTTALVVADNWWGTPDGPNAGMATARATANGSIVASPWAASPYAAPACARFAFAPARPVHGEDAVRFEDLSFDPSGGAIATRTWSWGDGSDPEEGGLVTEHTFPAWGSFEVQLTATTEGGGSETATRTVRVLARPSAAFEVGPGPLLETEALDFTDASSDPDGTLASWAWDFHDGSTASGAQASHRYADGGPRSASLVVTDDDGLQASASLSFEVAHVPPEADFGFGVLGEGMVSFTDLSWHGNPADAPGQGWTWAWDFGDGQASGERNPTHTFPGDDVYQVRLTVTDDDGMSAQFTRAVDLRNLAPVADFEVSPEVPVAGHEADFEDLSSDPDGTVARWAWDFGDGHTSEEQNPSHVYQAGGTYVVELTATDNDGASSTARREVRVCQTGLHLSLQPFHAHLEVCEHIAPL